MMVDLKHGHSEGPWHWECDDENTTYIVNGDGLDILNLAAVSNDPKDENYLPLTERAANAQLVSQAPHMLSTLEWALAELTVLPKPENDSMRRKLGTLRGDIAKTIEKATHMDDANAAESWGFKKEENG